MFSKLRPHHKRSGSTPTPTTPNSNQSTHFLTPQSSSHASQSPQSPTPVESPSLFYFGRVTEQNVVANVGANVGVEAGLNALQMSNEPVPLSPFPPVLPPIPRVASVRDQDRKWVPRNPHPGFDTSRTGMSRIGTVREISGELKYGYGLAMESGGDQRPGNGLERDRTREFQSGSDDVREKSRDLQLDYDSRKDRTGGTQDVFTPDNRARREVRRDGGQVFTGPETRPTQEIAAERVQTSSGKSNIAGSSFENIGLAVPLQPDGIHHSERHTPPHWIKSPPPTASVRVVQRYDRRVMSETRTPPSSSQDWISDAPRQLAHPFGSRDVSRQDHILVTPQKMERHGKTKLHLLNPMSLLMRRRNTQPLEHLADESLVTHKAANAPKLPVNYDPSIRGNVVHDFSSPRPKRNFSGQSLSTMTESMGVQESPSTERQSNSHWRSVESPYKPSQEHAAVFKEHFEDEEDQEKTDSAVRAETLANQDFISRNSFPPAGGEFISPIVLPPFARTAQTVYRPHDDQPPTRPPPPIPSPSTVAPSVPVPSGRVTTLSPLLESPVSPLEGSVLGDNTSVRTTSTSESTSSKSCVPRTTSTNSEFRQTGLPAHMLSRASRFSFQYAHTDSAAQEKLLEERHKQKSAEVRARKLAEKNKEAEEDQSEDENDDFSYDDDVDGFDDMEDDVPMVGEEWDYGGGGLGNMHSNVPINDLRVGMDGLPMPHMAQMALRSNPVDAELFSAEPNHGLGIWSLSTENSPSGNTAPIVDSKTDSYNAPNSQQSRLVEDAQQSECPNFPFDESVTGNPSTFTQLACAPTSQNAAPATLTKPAVAVARLDDDFYFDDGGIDPGDFDESAAFDESVFDDPSHPLFERPVVRPPFIPTNTVRRIRNEDLEVASLPGTGRDFSSEHPDIGASTEVVTAYHDALALAAAKAFSEGRFQRHDSLEDSTEDVLQRDQGRSSTAEEDEQGLLNVSSRPSLVPDDSRNSQATTMSPLMAPVVSEADESFELGVASKTTEFLLPGAYNDDLYSSEWDYSDYDSAMEDDPIIAAANAEALENDEEGFYGTEFGFYARPGNTDNSGSEEASLGGYFGPKNWGEIKRSRSTREPNLTPITERSEYSTRNSIIHFADRERAAPSPGLAQLARMSPTFEGEMSWEALRRLRRGAWGGSSGSLRSHKEDSSPMNSSPIGPKADSRALWSSPIGREVMGIPGDGGEDTENPSEGNDDTAFDALPDDADLYDEINATGVEDEWTDDSETSSDYDDGDTERLSTGWQYSAPDSPTIRAQQIYLSSPSPNNQANHEHLLVYQPHATSSTFDYSPPPTSGSTIKTLPTTSSSSPSNLTTFSHPSSSKQTCLGKTSLQQSAPKTPEKTQSGHSRNNSDSVAYVKERDEEKGEIRWFLERRRTDEDGVECLIGRTLVEGGRI